MTLTVQRRVAGLVALGGALALAGCGGTQKKADTGLAQASNVPQAPAVDRSKCDEKGKQLVTADTNQDKKPDVWKYFTSSQQGGQSVSVLSCRQVDLNHDGKLDMVNYYDASGAQVILEEADLDFDGQFDLTVYHVNGKRVREELDTNFDKKADVWKYYEEDKLVRMERDTDHNGKVDEWQYYEGSRLDRIGYDTTGSGRVDRWDRAPEGDESAPAEQAPAPQAGATPAAAPAAAPAATPAPGAAVPAAAKK